MTYQEVKNQVLKLLNQYTIAGTTVADTYNNQADYIKRIPGLINDAMMELSTTVRKIEKTVKLDPLDVIGDFLNLGESYCFAMPDDFFSFKSGDNWLIVDGRPVKSQEYTYSGGRWPGHLLAHVNRGHSKITVPKELVDNHEVLMTYYCYPELLDEEDANIPADTALDNVPEVHRAIPYYVAGVLAMHDDPFLASNLMNAYEDKLAKMQPRLAVETEQIRDVYYPGIPYPYDYHC